MIDPPRGPGPVFPGTGGDTGLSQRVPTTADAVDGVMPERVVQLRSVSDAVEVIQSACARHDPLVIRGGGTLLSIGNPPRELASVVATDTLRRILAYSSEDMVVTVEAGTTLAEIDRELAAAGQRLAIEAPHPEVATIGGVAAANYSHGLAFRFGSPRDQILGMTVVDGCGRVLRAGGRVVKNVAGYDLPRILIGSFGTLAVITDVTLRTQPRPEAEKRFVIDCDDEPSVDGIRQALFVSRLPLSSFEIVGQCDGNRLRWRLHLTTEGTTTEVESVHASIAAIARERGCGTDATAGTEEIAGQANYVARFATTPSNAIREASILLGIARGTASEVRAHLECGGVLLRLRATCVSDAQVVALAQACRERSAAGAGALLLERMPHEQKRSIDVWCGPIHGVALMRRLKARFDPYAVLAPGRFVGGI